MSPLAGNSMVLYVVIVFGAALILTVVVRTVALRRGWVARPSADRWHKAPTALHGGVGIFVAFFPAALMLTHGWSGDLPAASGPLDVPLPYVLLVGALGMFLVGFLDDLYHFKPVTKFLFQLLAANIFILAGGVFTVSGYLPIDLLLTYFWFIGITNAINMLDNMDGLASGVAIIALVSTVFLIHAAAGGDQPSIAFYIGLLLIASTLGFWIFNKPPASIFMGDSGALFLGFVLAALTIPSRLNGFLGVQGGGFGLAAVMTLIVPATVLAVPIFDTALVTITRQIRQQSPGLGGKDHSSHRLVGLGLSERNAVWMLYLMAMLGGSIAAFMSRFPQQSLPLFGFYALFLILMGVYLGRLKIQAVDSEAVASSSSWTPLVNELLHKRRAAEVLLDLTLVVLCFQAAYLLRFEGALVPETREALVFAYPFVVPSFLAALFLMRIYKGRWKFITVADLPNYAGAVLLGTALSLSTITMVGRFGIGHSRSVYVIHTLLFFLALVGSRLSFRIFDNLAHRLSMPRERRRKTPVLIYGAGRAGKLLRDELMYNEEYASFMAIGFIDDDPALWGQELSGLRVWSLESWSESEASEPVPEIWISSSRIDNDKPKVALERLGLNARIRRLHLSVSELAVLSKPA